MDTELTPEQLARVLAVVRGETQFSVLVGEEREVAHALVDAAIADRADRESFGAAARGDVATLLLARAQQVGWATLHYPARDVVVPMDGEIAAHLHRMIRTGHPPASSRSFDLGPVDGPHGWFVLGEQPPLAVSWHPPIRNVELDDGH